MSKREERLEVIRKLVRKYHIHTQQELTAALLQEGFDCTQATVSRDITVLGLVKGANHCYSAPEDLRLKRMLGDMVINVRYSNNIVVIRTTDGAAAGVAGAIDKANMIDVLGTVAGDDTIFVVVSDETAAARLQRSIMGFKR